MYECEGRMLIIKIILNILNVYLNLENMFVWNDYEYFKGSKKIY